MRPAAAFLRQPAGCSRVSDYEEDDVRVTTALNRMLGLPGAWVRDVAFGQGAVIVTVVLRSSKPVCSGCGARGLPIKEHRTKRWRALDLGGLRCVIECRLRRLYCPGCGDVYEAVPWARAGSRYTREFEDLTAWLAQQMSQTQVEQLLRIAWRTVGKILARVVADKLVFRPAGRASVHRRRRGQLRRRAQVPDLRRRPRRRLDRVGHRRPQRRQLAGVLRRAHGRAEAVDQGSLDRHVRRL